MIAAVSGRFLRVACCPRVCYMFRGMLSMSPAPPRIVICRGGFSLMLVARVRVMCSGFGCNAVTRWSVVSVLRFHGLYYSSPR